MTKCKREHTKFQPPGSWWKCSHCGNDDEFEVDDGDILDMDCLRIHKDDNIKCDFCGSTWNGEAFSVELKKLAIFDGDLVEKEEMNPQDKIKVLQEFMIRVDNLIESSSDLTSARIDRASEIIKRVVEDRERVRELYSKFMSVMKD